MADVQIRDLRFSVEMAETTTYDDISKRRRTFIPGLVRAQAEVFTGTYERDGREVANWAPVDGYGVTKEAARSQLLELAGQIIDILAEPDHKEGET